MRRASGFGVGGALAQGWGCRVAVWVGEGWLPGKEGKGKWAEGASASDPQQEGSKGQQVHAQQAQRLVRTCC